jgi:hypothetical protein
MNEPFGKHFPAHMVAHAHDRHDAKHPCEHANMDGDEENEQRDDEGSGQRFGPVKAHRRPCGGRAAFVMHSVKDFEESRFVHPAVRPIKPCVVDREISKQADRQIPERHGMNIGVNLGPAALLPAPCDDARRRCIDERAGEAEQNFAADLRILTCIKAAMFDAGGEGKCAAGDQVAHRDNRGHADHRETYRENDRIHGKER